ncbi:MAG: nickel-dependent lactate racemase [candidate division WOR-3 bacterium]
MNYGKKGFSLELPDEWDVTVVRKPRMPVLANLPAALDEAFKNPIACAPLDDLAGGRRRACILICDVTRPVPNGALLPPLVRRLMDTGLDAACITVVIATGLHRPNEGTELLEVVGDPWVIDTVNVVNHVARDEDAHLFLGRTTRGTPVRLDKRFVEADLRIVIGLVEPHFMAGYSGGRKVITPGIAHEGTITAIHGARFLEHELARNCVLEGNPIHEEQVEIARMVGDCYAINVVIDEYRRTSYVNFGALEESHHAAVAYMRPFAEVPVGRRFKTVVTTSAGYPLDRNYYQTVKGMVAAVDILEPGGDLFILSECSEGLGSEEFVQSQKRLCAEGMRAFMESVEKKLHAEVDEWETEMLLKALRVGNIYLMSDGLCGDERTLTGVCMVVNLTDAIRRSVDRHQDTHVAVIPEGPYVIPIHTRAGAGH